MRDPDPRSEPVEERPFWAHLAPFAAFFLAAKLLEDFPPWCWLAGAAAAGGALAWLKPWRDRHVWAHVAPFALWLALMSGMGEPAGWKYAVRSLAGAALLLWVRPWRIYGPLRLRNVPLALAVGVAIFLVWVGPETAWARAHLPALSGFYERYLVGPLPAGFGKLREPLASTPYAPEGTGWALWWVHMFGTSVVIAAIEEFFWRGFLYRWLLAKDFLSVDLGRYDRAMFAAVAIFFGLEHAEWFAGILCGLAFGWVILRTRDLWAAVLAHGVTNCLLGLYVLWAKAWWFW